MAWVFIEAGTRNSLPSASGSMRGRHVVDRLGDVAAVPQEVDQRELDVLVVDIPNSTWMPGRLQVGVEHGDALAARQAAGGQVGRSRTRLARPAPIGVDGDDPLAHPRRARVSANATGAAAYRPSREGAIDGVDIGHGPGQPVAVRATAVRPASRSVPLPAPGGKGRLPLEAPGRGTSTVSVDASSPRVARRLARASQVSVVELPPGAGPRPPPRALSRSRWSSRRVQDGLAGVPPGERAGSLASRSMPPASSRAAGTAPGRRTSDGAPRLGCSSRVVDQLDGRRWAGKSSCPREHVEGHHAHRVEVGLRASTAAPRQALGRDVGRRAADHVGAALDQVLVGVVDGVLHEAEVEQLDHVTQSPPMDG